MATDNSSWIRKYLQDRGFANTDIGFNKDSGMVTYQGKDFIKPESTVKGQTFASNDNLSRALLNYNTTQNETKVNDILGKLETNSQTPISPFQPTVQAPDRGQFAYNPDSDPQYQAALRRAQDNAASAGKAAQEELNARGILNSTVTSDRLGQIQQSEVGKVTDTVLPQLMQQAYQRFNDDYAAAYQKYINDYTQQYQGYTDQYNQGQDKFKNLQSLIPILSGINQQGLDNQFRTDEFVFNKDMTTKQFDASEDQRGKDNTRADRQLNATISNMTSDNARQNAAASRAVGNESQARLFEIWDRTGVAPAGIPGVPAGTPLAKSGGEKPPSYNLDDYKQHITNTFSQDVPIDSRYPFMGTKKVFDGNSARKYILGLNVSPEETAQMLQLFNLPLMTK